MAKKDKSEKGTTEPEDVSPGGESQDASVGQAPETAAAAPVEPAGDVELQRPPEAPAEGSIRTLSLESLQALLKDPGVTGDLRGDVETEIKVRLAEQEIDKQALLGGMTPRERALFVFGLEERHVLALKEYTHEDGSVEVVILTQGGQRLRWPKDEGRVLSDMEKGDAVPAAPSAEIFPSKK
jgi:hypothetical protein